MSGPAPPLPELIDRLFRRRYGQMVAGLVRVLGPAHLDLAEDVVQEALLRAMKIWPFEGVPQKPEAWLVHVARNLATDAVRRRNMARRVEEELQRWAPTAPSDEAPSDEVADDTLRMIFTCCLPSLPPHTRVALTLKTLCGFGTREISAALLQKETTVAQRLSRAKAQLREQGVEFEVPGPDALEERLTSVLEVLYLMFNEGYRVHRGSPLVRADLVQEAVRLGLLLLEIPQTRQPRVHALLALMLFLGARLPARTGAFGELLTLAVQDRALWDREWIDCGFHHFAKSIGGAELSTYHVEAAIASRHAAAPSYAETAWPAILQHYDQLLALHDSPVVRLNRSVAVAKVHGVDAALAELDGLADAARLRAYSLLPATRGHFLWLKGEHRAAAECFEQALGMGSSEPEEQFLRRRLAACAAGENPPDF